MLPKNFSKLRIPPTVQQCRGSMTAARYNFLYPVGGTESQWLYQTDPTCTCFISARQSASRTCMHSDCTNSYLPTTTLHRYRLWCV